MAGTLPGIPLSQQFSAIGKPLAGCLLYIYAANTTTPQDSFLDQGLTIKNPWPLAGDNSGRIPMFYLADGSVHVRLTDSGGVVQFDYPSMLVIGPSAGGGGPPPSVDPTTIFQTGDVMWLDVDGTRTGWVRDNGRTLGNAVSGGTERANADTQALFVFLWNTYNNGFCPVIGGRGANGLADFTAGKQITLPDKRGYAPVGNSAMGNFDKGAFPGVPFTIGSGLIAGSLGGEAAHLLTNGELPGHTHGITEPNSGQGHQHNLNDSIQGPTLASRVVDSLTGGSFAGSGTAVAKTIGVAFATTGITINTTGGLTPPGGGVHNVTQLSVIGTYYRKL